MTPLIVVAVALLAVALPLLVFAVVPSRAHTAGPTSVSFGPGAYRWIAPSGAITRLDRSLQLANLQTTWPVARVLRLKLILTAIALGLGVLLVVAHPEPWRVLVAVVLTGLAYFAPDVVIRSRAQERQERIQHELPDALDQVTIAVEAGLGLETAIVRVGQYGAGPLAEELTRTIQDMRVGFSRKEAWLALSARTDVVDLKRFARAIMQADQYGVSIGHVVRTQAKEVRGKRRQRAEERAMKVPVKVLFPLMFSILPVLFIVVLGPGVLNLLHVLGMMK